MILVKICQICVSWEVNCDMIAYLQVLIEEHHTKFKELYPDVNVIPKMHYMLHYPRQIHAFGPLVNTWTMRYEAKLRVIKRASRHGNFKNICLTVAKRHQHHLCYVLRDNECFIESESYGGCGEGSKVENELELQQYLEQAGLQVPVGSIALQPKWIKSGPYNLKKNAFLYVGSGTLYPKFAKIKNMFIVDSQIFIQLQSCETISFDSLYNSFVVQVLSLVKFVVLKTCLHFLLFMFVNLMINITAICTCVQDNISSYHCPNIINFYEIILIFQFLISQLKFCYNNNFCS